MSSGIMCEYFSFEKFVEGWKEVFPVEFFFSMLLEAGKLFVVVLFKLTVSRVFFFQGVKIVRII